MRNVLFALFGLLASYAEATPPRPLTQNSGGLTQNNAGLSQNFHTRTTTATSTDTDTAADSQPGIQKPLLPAPPVIGAYPAPKAVDNTFQRPIPAGQSGLPARPRGAASEPGSSSPEPGSGSTMTETPDNK